MSTNKPTARDGYVRGNPQGNALARRSILVVMGLGLMALVALVQFGENGIFAFFNLRSQEAELRLAVTELKAENNNLDQQIKDLAENREALEKRAREQHNMRLPEEEVLMIAPQPDQE